MAIFNVDWEFDFAEPPTTANSTTYTMADLENVSSLRFTGTGFTFDGNGVPTGGTITSVEQVLNETGGVLVSMTNVQISLGDFGNMLSDILALNAQITWMGVVTDSEMIIYTPTHIRFPNLDGTFTDIRGSGFSVEGGILEGVVTSIELVDTDGTTVLDDVAGLTEPLAIVGSALFQDVANNELLRLLHSGNNTYTSSGPITVGDVEYVPHFEDGAGNDTFIGPAGGGFVEFGFTTAGVVVDLAAHTATTGGDTNTLTNIAGVAGTDFNDSLTGDGGENQLYGEWGDDAVFGAGGDDRLDGGIGNDTIDGGAGQDTWVFEDNELELGVTVSLAITVAQDTIAAGVDTITGVENVEGTSYADTLIGSSAANVLAGHDGADTLVGGLGNDVILGGSGNDTIAYVIGDGADLFDGGGDTDTLNIFGNANENVLAASFNGGVLTNVAGSTGLSGVDIINANVGGGTDWLIYTATTTVTVNLGAGTASGFASVLNFENVIGGTGNDTLTGSTAVNRLDGAGGADTLAGGGGADILIGGDGADVLSGGLAGDNLNGGAGNDTLSWAWGDGADTLNGAADADTLNATGSGVDNIVRATWNGSAVTNLFDNVLLGLEAVNVDMLGGVDWLVYTASAGLTVNLGTGAATGFASITSIENVVGGTGGDALTGSSGDNRLDAGGGDDNLQGGGGVDTLLGGDGADILNGGTGNDSTQGGAGNDTFFWTWGDGRDTFNGGAELDTLNATGSAAENIVRATWNGAAITGLFDNALVAMEAINVDMDAGTDWLIYNTSVGVSVDLSMGGATGFASISNIENVIGGSGGDTFIGGVGANRLDGFSGDDTLNGGLGADTLIGAAGADTFVFSTTLGAGNVDIVSGFSVVDDIIHLDDAIFSAIAAGVLDADAFRVGAVAADAEDRIIYNSGSGALLYDADGAGGAAAVQFATLTAGLGLTEADFLII